MTEPVEELCEGRGRRDAADVRVHRAQEVHVHENVARTASGYPCFILAQNILFLFEMNYFLWRGESRKNLEMRLKVTSSVGGVA